MKFALVCAAVVACGALAHAGDERPAQPVASSGIAASTAELAALPSVSNAPAASGLPEAPSLAVTAPPVAMIKLKRPPSAHNFVDRTNTLAFGSLAAGLTADALSTQKGLAYPGFYEMNPLARAFVSSRAGAAAYSAGSFALLAGGMYIAHRKGHHKLERVLPFAVAGWEGWLSARNYHVISQNTR